MSRQNSAETLPKLHIHLTGQCHSCFCQEKGPELKTCAHRHVHTHKTCCIHTKHVHAVYTQMHAHTHTHPHTHSVTLTSYRSIGSSCCSSCSFIKRYSFWYFFIFLAVTCHGTANTNFNSWATQTVKTVKLNNILMNRSKITLKLHTIKTINKQFTSSSFSQWWEWDFSHISPAHTTFSPKTGWTAGFYLRHTHIAFSPNTGWTAGFYLRHTNNHTLPYHPLQGEQQGFTWDTLTNTHYLITHYRVNSRILPETH